MVYEWVYNKHFDRKFNSFSNISLNSLFDLAFSGKIMEPEGNEQNSPKKPWDEIRELDEHEKWRDRNTIITKHEHKSNIRYIGLLVVELFDEVINSYIKPDEECQQQQQQQQQQTNDVVENTTLPYIAPVEFENLLVDFSTEQENEPQLVDNQFSLFTNENDFKPASNFDFELSFFEQLNSEKSTDYLPRDSLFRTFDPLVTQLPVTDKPDTQVLTAPQSADLPLPEGNSVMDEVLISADSSDSEASETKETSFCSCQTKFPEETYTDVLTSGDDYESTNEDAILDCKMGLSPISRSSFKSIPISNNLDRIACGSVELDFSISNQINLDENINFPLPVDSKQTEHYRYAIENEEFRPSHEVDLALEYLEDLDIGIHDPNMPRESLFIRFDPLTQHATQPNELLRRTSQLSNSSIPAYTSEIPAKNFKNTNLLTFSTPPKSQLTPRLPITTPKPVGNETDAHSMLQNMTPGILDKPTKDALLSSSYSSNVLRYTESEVRAEVQKVRESVRSELVDFVTKKDMLLETEKSRMIELLNNERKKCNYTVKVKERKLQELKDQNNSNINSVMTSKSEIEGKYQTLQADVNLQNVQKELMTEELGEAIKTLDSSNERMKELFEDTEMIHSRKCRLLIELEDMTSSLTIFQTKISEATDSLKLNLNRINELITKIDQTARTSKESETRFNRLQERALNKLVNANTIHEDYGREYKQKLVVVKTELRTKKMELSDLQLSIKNYEAKNESLQGIAKEMMALHQPEANNLS